MKHYILCATVKQIGIKWVNTKVLPMSQLNENGLNQAKACGQALKDVKFDRILSSDLSRALVTAEAIRGDRTTPITVDERLRELNFGDWEAMLFSDIEARWPGLIDEMYLRLI